MVAIVCVPTAIVPTENAADVFPATIVMDAGRITEF